MFVFLVSRKDNISYKNSKLSLHFYKTLITNTITEANEQKNI
ncbi:hypothetical protein PBAL39_09961 [Pedobacter sp. BAL39]|nr:hypothetical protein PBAL39_09961 [Pedobacter sp. BAL39]